MNERIGDIPIGPNICSFSPYQLLLIKSRLFLFREGRSIGRKKYSWAKIASEISNLAEAPYLIDDEKDRTIKRYRHYVLSESRRGKTDKITEADIIDANFYISDDTLQRWFEGQPTRDRLEGKKPYLPSPQKIGAIRDFLVLNNHLHESELKANEPSMALAFVLNDLNAKNTDGDMPEFFSAYRSYTASENGIVVSILHFEEVKDADYLRFFTDIQRYELSKTLSFQNALDQLPHARLKRSCTKSGWIASGLRPSIVSFVQTDDLQDALSIEHFRLTALQNTKVAHFEFEALYSYKRNDERIIPIKPQSGGEPFVHNDYEHLFDFFEEKLYNERSEADLRGAKYASGFFQKDNSVEEYLYSEDDLKSGKALYTEVEKAAYSEWPDFEAPARLIRQGANVNYKDPETGWTTLHIAANSILTDTLDALLEREELDYLVRCPKGMLPSDMAFRKMTGQEYGMKLSEKQADQARAMGIDLGEFLTQPITPVDDSISTFDL